MSFSPRQFHFHSYLLIDNDINYLQAQIQQAKILDLVRFGDIPLKACMDFRKHVYPTELLRVLRVVPHQSQQSQPVVSNITWVTTHELKGSWTFHESYPSSRSEQSLIVVSNVSRVVLTSRGCLECSTSLNPAVVSSTLYDSQPTFHSAQQNFWIYSGDIRAS